MVHRNKTYIVFYGDTDMGYYNMLKAWKTNNKIDLDFYDAHDLTNARNSSLTESIKKQLRVRFDNSKIFLILVGKNTKWNRNYVSWEIKQAINLEIPIIVVNLNNEKKQCNDSCPVPLRDKLAIHIPFKSKILQYAIHNWPDSFKKHKNLGESADYFYMDWVYDSLSL